MFIGGGRGGGGIPGVSLQSLVFLHWTSRFPCLLKCAGAYRQQGDSRWCFWQTQQASAI